MYNIIIMRTIVLRMRNTDIESRGTSYNIGVYAM